MKIGYIIKQHRNKPHEFIYMRRCVIDRIKEEEKFENGLPPFTENIYEAKIFFSEKEAEEAIDQDIQTGAAYSEIIKIIVKGKDE